MPDGDGSNRFGTDGPSRRIKGEILRTGEGVDIHIVQEGQGWEVWVNTENEVFDGAIIGVGDTEIEARADAVITLNRAMRLITKERL